MLLLQYKQSKCLDRRDGYKFMDYVNLVILFDVFSEHRPRVGSMESGWLLFTNIRRPVILFTTK